jgi:hypothetical protein
MFNTDTKARSDTSQRVPLKLLVCTLTDATLTDALAIADLSVCSMHGVVTCTASVVRIALTHMTPANTISCK